MTAAAHVVPAKSRAAIMLGSNQAGLHLLFQMRLKAAAAAMLNTGKTGSKKRTCKPQSTQALAKHVENLVLHIYTPAMTHQLGVDCHFNRFAMAWQTLPKIRLCTQTFRVAALLSRCCPSCPHMLRPGRATVVDSALCQLGTVRSGRCYVPLCVVGRNTKQYRV